MRLRDIDTTGCYCRLIKPPEGRTGDFGGHAIERVEIVAFTIIWSSAFATYIRVPMVGTDEEPAMLTNERLLDPNDGNWERLFDAGRTNETTVAESVALYRFAGVDDEWIRNMIRESTMAQVDAQLETALANKPPRRGKTVVDQKSIAAQA